MSRLPVGFIGLGNMGKPMARNLVCDTLEAWVYDVQQAPVDELVALGAHAGSPAEIARHCRVIGLCVRDDRDVEALLYGEAGMLAQTAPGSVIAVHSTVTQAGLLRWAADAAARGIDLIDAPVSRGKLGKEPHFLCYMVGGDAAVLERCRPVLETSAESIIHAGPLGAGIALKLCNNLITYLEFIAMSEALAIATRSGLSIDVLAEVGRGNGVINDRMVAFAANREKLQEQLGEAGFAAAFGPFGKLGEKDLDAALETARSLGLHLPATELARSTIHDVFMNRGHDA
jgi:3-hydroxyisobutyrate dehydrogenase-like beta-hydroxyacid dehydrogenase